MTVKRLSTVNVLGLMQILFQNIDGDIDSHELWKVSSDILPFSGPPIE